MSDHLSLNNSFKITTTNMIIMYEKLATKSIKDIDMDKVNIKLPSFPCLTYPVVLQEVIKLKKNHIIYLCNPKTLFSFFERFVF